MLALRGTEASIGRADIHGLIDEARTRALIIRATVPGRGYRFLPTLAASGAAAKGS